MRLAQTIVFLFVFGFTLACGSPTGPSGELLPPVPEVEIILKKAGPIGGLRSYTLKFTNQPIDLFETIDYSLEKFVDFGQPVKIVNVSTFLGVDRGDLVEGGIGIRSEAGTRFYSRSEHKEASFTEYDAYDDQYYPIPIWTGGVTVNVLGRAAGVNPLKPPREFLINNEVRQLGWARIHYGIIFLVWELGTE
jgi:hypothetical protein